MKRRLGSYALLGALALAPSAGMAYGGSLSAEALERGMPSLSELTALDDYVAAPDANYAWRLESSQSFKGYRVDQIRLTSQAWRGPEDVQEVVWQHWLTVVTPTIARSSTALLIVSGGSSSSEPTEVPTEIGAYVAKNGSVIALLSQVPNQPLHFTDETIGRSEDEIISYTYDKYLLTGDETWPLLLPMTKSAVRAMDTVQTYLKGLSGAARIRINDFVITGASKRGWTTWLTTAVDPRVKASIPIVIDVLQMDRQLDHHYRAYGFYSYALDDYVAYDIPCRIWTPEGQDLKAIVDPYAYLDRYTKPKYVINAAGDQFFLPDGSQFYFHDLPGESRLRYVPNVDHGLGGGVDVLPAAFEYFEAIVNNVPRPSWDWTFQADGTIRAVSTTKPTQVLLWQAVNPTARDFRLDTIGASWTSTVVNPGADGSYSARVPTPAQGWTAFFLEATFPSNRGLKPFVFTTDIRILPDVLPFPSDSCQ